MSLKTLTQSFFWSLYSKKLANRIEKPRHGGKFHPEQSKERGMRLVIGKGGALEHDNVVLIFWLVDPDDGIIVDARFQAYGQSPLIGAAELASELVIGKNYDQANRLTTDLIDKQARDRTETPSFPKECVPLMMLVINAIHEAAKQCLDIPLSKDYIVMPAPREMGEVLEGGYPGWETLSTPEKIGLIEGVIATDIRPYVELDAGGVQVMDLLQNREVIIAFQGSCTSCFSATGTTLAYIQQVLKARVHPDLIVIPDLTTFHEH